MNPQIIDHDKLPPPDTLVRDARGQLCALMFWFAPSDTDLTAFAEELGFDISVVSLDIEDDDCPLAQRYRDGDSTVCDDWGPTIPDGWQFGMKTDTEDGPQCVIIRKRPGAPP